MKINITHSCGHSETVNLHGSNVHGRLSSRRAWLERRPCKSCAQQRANTRTDAGPLDGTQRQIQWADEIRKVMIKKLERFYQLDKMSDELTASEKEDSRRTIDLAIYNLLSYTKAEWFIKNEGIPTDNLLTIAYYNDFDY